MVSDLSYNALFRKTLSILTDAAIVSPELEARLIVEKAANKTRAEYIRDYNQIVPPEVIEAAQGFTERRLAGEPVAYITGEWELYSLPFFVSPDTLIPRADSETLVAQAIKLLQGTKNPHVLDLCAGTGCLGIAVAKNVSDATLTLADISTGALKMCKKNAARNSVAATVCALDALETPPGGAQYDMILNNPPYITTDEIETLDASVRNFEPHIALDGGNDGLKFYRAVAAKWKTVLVSGGYLIFECGAGQADDVRKILATEGFTDITQADDIAGIPRVVIGRK